jgi:hypothetical protein
MSSGFGGSGKYKSKIVFGVAFIAAVPLLLSTFAASVTVGTGALEFGQGSQQAIACDQKIYVALGQEWYASPTPEDSSAGYFRVRSVTVSNLDLAACAGKKLRVRLIDNTSREIQVGPTTDSMVLQISLPNPSPVSNVSDPVSLGLSYLTGIGAPISTTLIANAVLSVSGTSIYDGSILSIQNGDATFYLDATSSIVNIDGQRVFRSTVETIDNPSSRAQEAPAQPAPSETPTPSATPTPSPTPAP